MGKQRVNAVEKLAPGAPVRASVAVIGAGVSGLAAAYRLQKAGVSVTVYEAGAHCGGKIRTLSKDGYMWETAANTMVESGEAVVTTLIDELNIRNEQIWPKDQRKRYVVMNGTPQLLPNGPLGLIATPLLSAQAKVRMVLEPLLWKKDGKSEDESVASFMERHFGREVVDVLLDPFCAGTSGSDPSSLAVKYAFPVLKQLETRNGSVVVGALTGAARGTGLRPALAGVAAKLPAGQAVRPGSFSFLSGLQTLPSALAAAVGPSNVRLQTPVVALKCEQQGDPSRSLWTVTTGGPRPDSHNFDSVIVTAPLDDFRKFNVTKSGRKYPLSFLPQLKYQPISVLVTAFREEDVKRRLPGFGLLASSKEQAAQGLNSLGTIFSSEMFPNRSPKGTVLFTTLVGGSRNPDLARRPLGELQSLVLQDLQKLLGVEGKPLMQQHVFWERAFPQYGPSFGAVLAAYDKLEKDLPGLYYAGNNRDGLSVGRSLASGYDSASLVLSDLSKSGHTHLHTMA